MVSKEKGEGPGVSLRVGAAVITASQEGQPCRGISEGSCQHCIGRGKTKSGVHNTNHDQENQVLL